jgi:hypothetical protein
MPDFQQESVWFITFVGLILSDVTCCLILYIYWKYKHLNQLPLKVTINSLHNIYIYI